MEPHSTSLPGPAPLGAMTAAAGMLLAEKKVPFLATKVVAPRCFGLIERPRLLDMAARLASKRLAVIKGPAGFGKTSLAATWYAWLCRQGSAVAWMSIDTDDDEPARFLLYMAQAMQRAAPDVGAGAIDLINEAFLIGPQAVVSSLINDLTDVEDETYLFLEDFHWVTHPEIHAAIAFFLTHVPSHIHVVLTTRTEPPLPLASLRANNQLLEIDAAALRFDAQETRAFLEHERPGSLDVASATLLHARTEGWPAALRIVVATAAPGQDFSEYVRSLSGVQRPIDDYLTQMLDGLPGELVLFMLRTAILDRLSAPLCEAVTGSGASRALLASIEKRQLLLIALDPEGRWFRYHPLLADHLGRRLESERRDEVAALHLRAARWYADEEMWTQAVQHAIAAGDMSRALGWIKNCAMDLVKRGDLLTLLAWQRLFPPDVMRGQPAIKLAIAWGLALAVRPNDAMQMLDEIESDIETRGAVDREVLVCECQAIRSVALSLKDEGREALPLAQACLTKSNDPWTANVASNVVRYWLCQLGDLDGFYATPWIPYSVEDDRRNLFASVYRRCIQGIVEARQLRLGAAERYFTEASQLAERHVGPNSIAAALPAALISRVRYELGQVDEAEAMLIDRLPLISAGAMIECVLSACFTMVRVAAYRNNFDRAHTLLERADSLGWSRDWVRLCAGAGLERVRLHLQEGRLSEAIVAHEQLERLAEKYPPSVDFAWSEIPRCAALARASVASAQQRHDDAIATLTRLREEAARAQNHYFALRVATHLAIVRLDANQVTGAVEEFGRVLKAAASAGIRQTILDEGPRIGTLLDVFAENGERSGGSPELKHYLGDLVAASRSRHHPASQPGAKSVLVDSLSAREGTILKLIGQGLSNKEIARNLAIAPETVKSHVKHIFTKLGAEKRAQAVARAQSLGLVTTI